MVKETISNGTIVKIVSIYTEYLIKREEEGFDGDYLTYIKEKLK